MKQIQLGDIVDKLARLCNFIVVTSTGATSGAGTAYPSGAYEFTQGF